MVWIKIGIFQQRFDQSMFRKLWGDTRWQRLINDIGNYRNNLFQTMMKNRGWNWVEVTRLFCISWSTAFMQSLVTSWNSAKRVPENSIVSVGIGMSGPRLLLICSILLTTKSLSLSERDSGGMFVGRTVPTNVPIIWLLRGKSSRELSQFTIFSQFKAFSAFLIKFNTKLFCFA